MSYEAIPADMRERKQWVAWRYEQRDGKRTKVPLVARLPKDRGTDSTQRRFPASTTDPRTWGGFEEAQAIWRSSEGFFDGIGYVFAEDDPYAGIDLDDCVRDGELWGEAAAIVLQLATYTERSPSDHGVHLIARAHVNGRRNRTGKTSWGGTFEVYDKARFFCVTGNRLPDTPATIEPRQAELDELLERMFPAPATNGSASGAARPPLELDDRELLARAGAAKNGGDFDRLYRGDFASYPSQSEADLALCNMLAFWTGPDAGRLDRLFRGSGLMRDKWDESRGDSTYGAQTVARALEGRTEFYAAHAPQTSSVGTTATPAEEQGPRPNVTPPPARTDLGNAQRFAVEHGHELRHVRERRLWLGWDEKRWRRDATGDADRAAKQTVRRLFEDAARLEDADERKAAVQWALASQSEPRIRAMLTLAATEPEIALAAAQLDQDPWRIACPNGALDLRSAQLRPNDPADLITLGVDIAYEPNATCRRWEQFLTEIFAGDVELIEFVQRFVGYCLTGDTREHVLAVLQGSGCNGKSTFLSILKRVLGDFCVTAGFDTFMRARGDRAPRNDLARLHRARLVTAAESGEGRRLDERTVKEITGGDTITARFLYGEHFEFIPQFKLMLVTNHRPKVDGDDDAIWRRLRLIPFEQSFEGREDRELGDKLEAELPGILAWAVRGCLAWQQHGLGQAAAVTRATSEYRQDEDLLGAFLEERCIMAGDTSTVALREAYEDYCRQIGEKPLAANVFGRRLAKRGIHRDRRTDGNRERIYRGLSLR